MTPEANISPQKAEKQIATSFQPYCQTLRMHLWSENLAEFASEDPKISPSAWRSCFQKFFRELTSTVPNDFPGEDRYDEIGMEAFSRLCARLGQLIKSIHQTTAWQRAGKALLDRYQSKPTSIPPALRSHPALLKLREGITEESFSSKLEHDQSELFIYQAEHVHFGLTHVLTPFIDASAPSSHIPFPQTKDDCSYDWEVWRLVGSLVESVDKGYFAPWYPPLGTELYGWEPYDTNLASNDDPEAFAKLVSILGVDSQSDARALSDVAAAYPQCKALAENAANREGAVALLLCEAIAHQLAEMSVRAAMEDKMLREISQTAPRSDSSLEEITGYISRAIQLRNSKK